MGYKEAQSAEANPRRYKNTVHRVLAHSYLFYFLVFLFAFSVDFIFPLKLNDGGTLYIFGFALMFLGTCLVVLAQVSSRKLKKENMTCASFCLGPYRYLRAPTNLGIFLAMLGFGLGWNSFFIVFFSIFSFITTQLTFIREEERILAEKYGAPYLEYKKLVRF